MHLKPRKSSTQNPKPEIRKQNPDKYNKTKHKTHPFPPLSWRKEKIGKRRKKHFNYSLTHSISRTLAHREKKRVLSSQFIHQYKPSTLYYVNMFSALSNTQHADCSPTALAMASSPTGHCNTKCGNAHPCSKHDQEVTDGNCPAGGNCNWIDYGGGEGYCTKCGGYSQGYWSCCPQSSVDQCRMHHPAVHVEVEVWMKARMLYVCFLCCDIRYIFFVYICNISKYFFM
jgi:hypothetical protein